MIWLIGVGYIGIEYGKVLNALKIDYIAVGRGEQSAKKFEETCKHKVIRGGLELFLKNNSEKAISAIVAVKIESLYENAMLLINYGIKRILIEKPGFNTSQELETLNKIASQNNIQLYVGYNRRFYSSVLEVEKRIQQEGGVKSLQFEFTEWCFKIDPINYNKKVLLHWIIANSSHVIDTAFYLCGKPKELSSLTSGENKISWHPNASIFAGAGKTDKNALFTYSANWNAPGRWGIELLTDSHRYYLKPMEKLKIQEIGSIEIKDVDIDDSLDSKFKPGLFLETKSFIENKTKRFKNIKEVYTDLSIYKKICNYIDL